MTPIKQSLSWWCFFRDDLTPEKLVSSAREMGYKAFDFVPPEHFDLVRDNGMTISLILGHDSLPDGMNRPENHDRIYAEIEKNLETAVKYEIPNLCCFSGNRYFEISDIAGAEICAEIMTKVAPLAEDAGVNLTMELLNSRVSHPGYQCDRTEWGVLMCKLVNSPRVRLLYDIFHMQIMEGDLIRTIQDNIEWISHIHTAGNPGRNEMDETQEIFYPPIAQAIAELDYQGYVSHELVPTRDVLTVMQESYDIFNVG